MKLYRGGKEYATHIFHEKVESGYKNYYKAGIYYQNKDSPKIFSEVFIRDLKVAIEQKFLSDSTITKNISHKKSTPNWSGSKDRELSKKFCEYGH